MKKSIIGMTIVCLLSAFSLQAEVIRLQTPSSCLLLNAERGGDLTVLHYGERVPTEDVVTLNHSMPSTAMTHALPAFGTVDMIHLPALQVEHSNGDLSLNLSVADMVQTDEKDYSQAVFTLQDKVQPFEIKVYYKAWHNVDIIETWTSIRHTEKRAVTLKRFDSGHLFLPSSDIWLTHLHGDWAGEAIPTNERLQRGEKVIRNTDGARNAHLDAPQIMLSLDGEGQENSGRVIGAALCWSGNFEIRLNAPNNEGYHLYAGIDPQSSEYVLEPNSTFTTPHLALTYSTEGMGGASRAFHKWARHNGMLHNGNTTRDILLNSWEGIYFDITEERITDMMTDIALFGGELFVMDDGWFGSKYQRLSDDAALGDWVVDKRKLPNGLEALTKAANERHIKFGIWIEPEAVNTRSELFEQHPEWALQVEGRDLKLGRGGTQLVLDMTNPQVQDYVFSIVDNLLSQHPEIAYIKWDANASIQNLGHIAAKRSDKGVPTQNIYIDYHLGLIRTLQRIRERYPDVVIQNCASGGGRANYGLMPYFDEFWVSDNNDALQRVFIQWGMSYFFPSNAMAQHIGGSPYLMTGRTTPIKFRCDVAMSGRLGMELQPTHMNKEEREQCTVAFRDYKELRSIIQLGNLYRLLSPYTNNAPAQQQVASLMYVTDNKAQAVLFAYGLSSFMKQSSRVIRLAGLAPERRYTIKEKNVKAGAEPCALDGKTFSGAYLMEVGLPVPLNTEYSGDYPSRIFLLEAAKQESDNLLQRLTRLQKKGCMFGHQDDPLYGVYWKWEEGRSDVLESCGDYPAVMGFDLGGIELGDSLNLDKVPFALMREHIQRHHRRGGIVTLSWHPRNPVTGESTWDAKEGVVKQILTDAQTRQLMQDWLKRVSAFIGSLTDDDGKQIPLIFRPWHENNGSWFWWGETLCTANEYKSLWNMTQDYVQSAVAGSSALLWCYSPNLQGGFNDSLFLARYPGDDRVDLLGLDAYQWGTEEEFVVQTNADLRYLSDYALKHNKLLTLSECGRQSMPDPTWWERVLLPILQSHRLSYALLWRNEDEKEHFGPIPKTESAQHFLHLYNDSTILFLRDITPENCSAK